MNVKPTRWLLILLVLAAGAFWLAEAQMWAPPALPVKEQDPLRIFTVLLPEVRAIVVSDHSSGRRIRWERGEGPTWWLSEPERKQLDADKMLSLGMTLTSLAAERVLTDTTVVESFGLSSPALSVEIIGQSRTQALDVGKPTPIGGAVYAQRRGSAPVYLLSARTLSDLRQLMDWLPTAGPNPDPTLLRGS